MNILLPAPILLPFLTGILSLLVRRRVAVHKLLGISGAALHLAAGCLLLLSVARQGVQAVQIGSWPAPFGITLVADLFSAILVVVAGALSLLVVVYSLGSVDEARQRFGLYTLIHFLLMGVSGAFLTGDVFNLYVWFEVMLMSSFVLLALGGEEPQMEGAIKYVTLNLLSSALFLAAAGILYGLTGTLNMADAAGRLGALPVPALRTVLAMLFLVAFGIKAAVFPFFFWLPASYHTPPVAVTTLFSGLLTKVGVYALIRFFTLLFPAELREEKTILLLIAGATMVTGVLGAMTQTEIRKLLSFHIVSQIGYLVMGLALGTEAALAGSVFFLVHVIMAKSALFMVGGVIGNIRGTSDLARLGGLAGIVPWLAVVFVVPALALAGVPPLSGFWAKFLLVKAGLQQGEGVIVAVALGVSVLTLYSMKKIWAEAFWKRADEGAPATGAVRLSMVIPAAALGLCTLLLGIAAEPFLTLCLEAARGLVDPSAYIRAVLGGG